jgi:hypothetical protein
MGAPSLTYAEELVLIAALALAAILGLIAWWRRLPVTANPWPADVEAAVNDPDAVPLCFNCLAPQDPPRWFCRHCGHPTGENVAVMHFLYIFLIGEMYRRGVNGPPEKSAWMSAFLAFASISFYGLFAPVYWFWLLRKAVGRPIGYRKPPDLAMERF